MKSTSYNKILHLGVFLVFLQYSSFVSAQFPFSIPTQGTQGFGTQRPPDSTKLPTLDQRAEALKNAGVPQEVLNDKVLPNTGTPSNPINQPLATQTADTVEKPLTAKEKLEKQKEENKIRHIQMSGTAQGIESPVIYRRGDNVDAMTLYNTETGLIDTFRIENDWYKRYLAEEKLRKQEEFDNILKSKNTLYGQHLFIKGDFTRADTSAYSPPESYVVQPGDKFLVQVTGKAELFEYLEVDKDGTVFRQFMGKKVVAGSTYSQARKTIENGYRNMVPSGTTIIISLVKNKNVISVNVTGEVKEPGTYTLPNITNAISALFAAKGIGGLGTLRSIQIKREGAIVKTIDLYDYLINGKTEQIYLKNNDFIFVPMQKNVVSIDGGVKRPMRYELKDNETVNDLVRFAGGLTYEATKSNASINRLDNGKDEVLDINLATDGSKKMQDGDELNIRNAYRKRENVVQIAGSVKYPGAYDWTKGKRVKDLINKAGGLTDEAYLQRAYIVRIPKPGEIAYIPIDLRLLDKDTSNNATIQYLDQLIIYNNQSLNANVRHLEVTGHVTNPNILRVAPKMTLKQVLYAVGGPVLQGDVEDIELSTFIGPVNEFENQVGLSYGFTPIYDKKGKQIEPANKLPESITKNRKTMLRIPFDKNWQNNPAWDTIFVDNYQFIQFNTVKKYRHIKVEGYVKKPGTIRTTPEMTMKQLLFAVGGPSQDVDGGYVELGKYIGPHDSFDKDALDDNMAKYSKNQQTIARTTISADWKNDPQLDTMKISNYDFLTFYSKYAFLKTYNIESSGAVNRPTSFIADSTTTLKDLIFASGGFPNESEIKYIDLYLRMPLIEKGSFGLKTNKEEIKTIEVDNNWQTNPIFDSITVKPYYKVYVHDQRKYLQSGNIEIKGFVLSPGSFAYLPKMTLKDAIYLAGGLKIETEFSKVEISRILDVENTNRQVLPVKIKSIMVSTSQDWQQDPALDKIILLPYDQIFIRPNPDWKFQEGVSISGEVLIPGEYNKSKPEEKLSDLVARSGGLTSLAFTGAAYLTRPEYGIITINLTKALSRPGSKFDLTLRKGDALTIPKISEVITVQGYIFRDTINTTNAVSTASERNFMYDPAHRSMKYYVDLAGGFQERTKKRDCTVSYPNGTIKKAQRHLFLFHTYPRVSQGAIINIAERENSTDKIKRDGIGQSSQIKEKLTELMGFMTSMITLLVLVKAATK